MKRFLFTLLSFSFLFISCFNAFDAESGTYIVFSSNSRAAEKSTENLTNISLTGNGAGSLNKTWSTAEKFLSDKIEIEAGSWNFTLTASLEGNEYTASVNANIIAETENQIVFMLKKVGAASGTLTNVVYVASNGLEDNLGTISSPVDSIASALERIHEARNPQAWTIYICDVVTGSHSIILDSDYATSLTIEGKTGNSADILEGAGSGTVLNITTTVPVTIKNLKITGGNNTSGGGIYIGTAAKVALADGVVISGNTATNGGGVYNEGNLFMYGSAVIGDVTATSVATSSNYANSASNQGGGLYNAGTAYLGYSSLNNDGSPKAKELTAGICNNFGSDGGGAIFNQATLYINSGNFNYNSQVWGGAIRTSENSTQVIYISGGTISYNTADRGGGICLRGGNLIMSGGEISNNTSSNGGGIAITDAAFTMTGGSIMNNSNSNILYERGNGCTIGGISKTGTITDNIINAVIQN